MTDSDLPLRSGGYLGTEQGIARLLSDLRVMSGAGVERAAWGWSRHGESGLDRYREAERAAVHLLEADGRGEEWESLRREILDLTEGRGSLVAWRAEHGPAGHGAEQAALGAALGLLTGGRLGRDDLIVLLHPMDEALPWLLPEVPAEPAS